MKNLNWPAARILALQGKAIRRDAWRKWLTHGAALWYIDKTDDAGAPKHYVVPAPEFTAAEFLASDWTDEPWTDATTGQPVTPPTGVPVPPGAPGGVGGRFPGDIFGNIGKVLVQQPNLPGGAKTAGDPTPPIVPDPPSGQNPVVTVEIIAPGPEAYEDFDNPHNCFIGGDAGTRTLGELAAHVSVAAGPFGPYPIDIRVGSGIGSGPQIDNAFPGFNKDFVFTDIPYLPGGTITVTATYSAPGGPFVGTKTFTFPTWCAGHETCVSSDVDLTFTVSGMTRFNPLDGNDRGIPNGTFTLEFNTDAWTAVTTTSGADGSEDWVVRVECSGGIYSVSITGNTLGSAFGGNGSPNTTINSPGIGNPVGGGSGVISY